jgi:hypothetical protein
MKKYYKKKKFRKLYKRVKKVYKKMKKYKRRKSKLSRSTGAPRTDTGTGAQLFAKKFVRKFKSKLSQKGRLLKEVKANEKWFKQRFSAIAPYRNTNVTPYTPITPGVLVSKEKGAGAYWFYNAHAPSEDKLWAPLYLFDLTAATNYGRNVGSTSDGVVPGFCGFRLAFDQADPDGIPTSTNWDILECGNGVTGRNTYFESEDYPAADRYPGNKSMLMKTDVDLFLYGAAGYATEFSIQIVKLKHMYQHPLEDASVDASDNQDDVNFWTWYSRPYASHPLADTFASKARDIQVLYEKKITLQAVTTNEGYSNPLGTKAIPYAALGPQGSTQQLANIGHNQRFKMTFPWAKMVSFDWQKPEPAIQIMNTYTAGSNQTAPNNYGVNRGFVSGNADFDKRIYLCVRALNPCCQVFSGEVTPLNTENTPSMDVKIRNTWVKL